MLRSSCYSCTANNCKIFTGANGKFILSAEQGYFINLKKGYFINPKQGARSLKKIDNIDSVILFLKNLRIDPYQN